MSDADSSRRPKSAAPGQRTPRFEARQEPLPPPPRPMAKVIELPEELPELRPRTVRRQPGASAAGASAPRLAAGSSPAPLPIAPHQLTETAGDLQRVELFGPRPAPIRPIVPVPAARRSILEFFWGNPWLIVIAGVVCFAIYMLASAPSRVVFSNYTTWGGAAGNSVSVALAPIPGGEHTVRSAPTITAEDVEAVLRQYNSPAAGTGRVWIEKGSQYGIDPAYALAFFIHESTGGTNPGWAGLKPGGGSTHNIGNIICAGYLICYKGFRDYPSWDAGIEDWYKLVAREYIEGRGLSTVEQILPVYCPVNDGCLTNDYVSIVNTMVDQWRQGKLP